MKKPAQAEIPFLREAFTRIAGFPNVFGTNHGTHILIQAPVTNEHEYLNRKNFHSVNVQVLCNADLMVMDCVAKYPGSAHDARILRESPFFRVMERHPRVIKGLVLGDCDYPMREWLMTPILNPGNHFEESYNGAHATTRSVIERCFGVAKRRWKILHKEMRREPQMACKVILICFMLHNRARSWTMPLLGGEPDDDDGSDNTVYDTRLDSASDRARAAAGRTARNQTVQNYFSR